MLDALEATCTPAPIPQTTVKEEIAHGVATLGVVQPIVEATSTVDVSVATARASRKRTTQPSNVPKLAEEFPITRLKFTCLMAMQGRLPITVGNWLLLTQLMALWCSQRESARAALRDFNRLTPTISTQGVWRSAQSPSTTAQQRTATSPLSSMRIQPAILLSPSMRFTEAVRLALPLLCARGGERHTGRLVRRRRRS